MTKRKASSNYGNIISSLNNLSNFMMEHRDQLPPHDEIPVESLIPMVVMVGDQSSGKSSFLSALIGQDLPIGSGKTTSCRIEVRMRKSDTSKKTMRWMNPDGSLQQEFLFSDGGIERFHKDLIKNLGEKPEHKFSYYGIIIEIHGTEVEDVTFVDLPGLIAEQDDCSDQVPVKIIEHYISRPNCLIVNILSMAEGDMAGARSVRLVRKHDPSRSRTVTVFTKVDYHFHMPQRVLELVKKEDPNGILVMTRKPNIETQRDEIVEEETEISLLSGFRATVAVGRKVVLDRIKDFTSDMIEKNRAQIISSLNKQQRSIAEVLYKIGDSPERPTQIHFRWSRMTRDLVFEIKEGRNGTYVESLEKLRLDIPNVLPMEWPSGKEIQPHEVQRDLDQIRGTHLDFMVGSEPLVKKYTKSVTEFISNDLFSWVDKVENTLKEMISLALTQEPGVPNSCLEAGGRVASDILVLLEKKMNKWRADLNVTLEDVHQNPRLLDSNDVAKEIKDLRDAPITEAIQLLCQYNAQAAVEYLLRVKANTNSVKETEAGETIIKTTAYWHGRMISFQKSIFQQMNEIRNAIENEICEAVDRFEDVDLLKENDVQTRRREILKRGAEHCKAVLDALRLQ